MSKPELKVVEMRAATLRDIPAMLRLVADRMEAGEYGPVGCAGLCVLGNEFHVFGWGNGLMQDGNGPSVSLMFQAAVNRLANSIESHGKS